MPPENTVKPVAPTTIATKTPAKIRKKPSNKLADVETQEFDVDCAGDQKLTIVRRKVTKGAAQNNEYFAPILEGMTPETFISLFDPIILMNWVGRHIRAFCATVTAEAVKYAGEDEQKLTEKFEELFLKLSRVGDTNRALVLRLKELLDRFNDIDTDTPEGNIAALALFNEVKEIKKSLAEKKVSDEEENSAATEAAKAKNQPIGVAA